MLLNSNADVMGALRAYYVRLLDNEDFPLRTECQKNIQNFAADIESNILWTKMQTSRLSLLAEIIDGRKDLVRPTIREITKVHISNYLRLPNTSKIRLQRGPNN